MIAILFSLAFLATLAGYATYRTIPMSKYLYANARASARSKDLLTKEQLERMCDATSFNSFLTYLRDTIYSDCCNVKNARELHIHLEKKLINEIMELSKDTPPEFKRVIDAYIMKFEGKMIKLLMKSKMKDITIPSDAIYPIGNLTQSRIDELIRAKTIADFVVALQRTNFAGLFVKSVPKTWEEAEERIDRFVERRMYKRIREAKIPFANELLALWKEKARANVMLLALRARLRGVDKEKINELIEYLGFPELTILNEVKIEEIPNLKNIPFGNIVSKMWEEIMKTKEFGSLELEIDKEFEKRVSTLSSLKPEGVFPVFEYMIKKNNERKKLQIIGKLIEEGLNAEEIKRMVI